MIGRSVAGLVLASVLLAGCDSGTVPGVSWAPLQSSTATASLLGTGSTSAGASTCVDIPPGRGIAEGGGGPLNYTFREEWRRARAEAQTWRSGAYLISASGQYVNDDGVPSSWTTVFIDRANADAVRIVEIDPWGKVTSTRTVTGSGIGSFVDANTGRIPCGIIDSDTAVRLGKAALATGRDLSKSKDPRLGLSFSSVDGSGPWWSYSLLYSGSYITATINALTGVVQP
jgi:hypothetical protein